MVIEVLVLAVLAAAALLSAPFVFAVVNRRQHFHKGVRKRAERILAKHGDGAEAVVRARLDQTDISAGERRFFRTMLRGLRAGSYRSDTADLDLQGRPIDHG